MQTRIFVLFLKDLFALHASLGKKFPERLGIELYQSIL